MLNNNEKLHFLMKNWSKRIEWNPSEIAYPTSEEAIQQVIQKAIQTNKKVRIIGSAHSFNPLWVTDSILVSLDEYSGLVVSDKDNLTATVRAGTKLFELGVLLFQQGMAMENLGDIDRQSLGGTIGTGTHGTGLQLGTISTQVIALRLINGKGEIMTCSTTENVDLFKAAQVSLGALGIITEITLQCVPAYKLALENKNEPLEFVIADFKNRIKDNRNFEFYYFPHSNKAWTKSSNIIEDTPDKVNFLNYLTEYALENYAFQILCEWARWFPSQNKIVSKISAATIPNLTKVFHSHKIYATQRLVRFNEMEYNVPLEAHESVLKEMIKTVESKKFDVHFPIENRVVKGDDIYLSPAYGRDAAYIACHVYNKKDHRPYFKAMEEILLAHDGRPHWGKMHTLTANDFSKKYPKWADFQAQRKAQDPSSLFQNDYLNEVLGEIE
jgi:FAD-linked oxidoreductase